MRYFCEVLVEEVFPAVRAIIANELTEKYNYTQEEAAKKLGRTQPAISQYKKHLRGKNFKLITENEQIMLIINNVVSELAKLKGTPESNEKKYNELRCTICSAIKLSNIISKFE